MKLRWYKISSEDTGISIATVNFITANIQLMSNDRIHTLILWCVINFTMYLVKLACRFGIRLYSSCSHLQGEYIDLYNLIPIVWGNMGLFSSHADSVRCFISDWSGRVDAIYYAHYVMKYFLSYAARQWLMGPKVKIGLFSRNIKTPTNTANNPHEANRNHSISISTAITHTYM